MPKPNRLSRHQPAKTEQTRISLALSFDTNKLPTKFRIFKKGINTTEKGPYLFDALAAKLVMASYVKWGIDLPIDLDHQMADSLPGAADPTARDARGWCKLAVLNEELWAVDVRWTPDGTARLTEKRQRYVSPLFLHDSKTRRVIKMLNIAITALPATHDTPALVAAAFKIKGRNMSTTATTLSMDKDLVMKALEALQAGDDEAATEILKGMIAGAASGEEPGADDGAEGDDAEGVAPPAEGSEVSPKVTDTSGDAADPGDPAEDPDEKDDADPAKKPERKAMRAMLRNLTGAKTFGAALTAVETFRASHMTLETERAKLAADRAVLERAERRACVVELVTLGAEFPSTVWADDKAKTIKPRWLKMPIEELRAHTLEQRAARKGQKGTAGIKPPPGEATVETVELSAGELQICKDTGCDPKEYVRLKAKRDGGDGSYFQALRDRDAAAQALIAKVGN